MQDFMDAVIFSFKELLRPQTSRYALGSGFVVTLVWIIIGYAIWPTLVNFTSSILSMLPFSMIRANGAWMLSSFIWLQAVLVTFALIFTFLGNLISQKIQAQRYSAFALVIALLSALFWSIIWISEGDVIYTQALKLFTWLPFETIEKALAYLIAFYILYTGVIITLIFTTSMLSHSYFQAIKEHYFPYDLFYGEPQSKTIIKTLKDTGVFILLSIVTLPLLFIPVVNFFILVFLWIWLMKDTLAYDTSAYVFGKEAEEKRKEYKVATWGFALLGSLFNFIPVFNVFGPYFSELAMLYYYKEKRDLAQE
jgi:hypothetical protein